MHGKLTEEEVVKLSDRLFQKQSMVLPLWQTLAENFYPERADFTITRNVGEEFADNLIDSYPLLARRDMGNALSAMLRDGDWFSMTTSNEPDGSGREWLQWAGARMGKQFGDRRANFVRATKQGDHDYVAFGQAVLQVRPNATLDGLLYKSWHLRDCAWSEDDSGNVDQLHRKWEPTYWTLSRLFKKEALHQECVAMLRERPHDTIECRHIVMPAEMYGDEQIARRFEYVSIYIDIRHKHIIEAVGQKYLGYVVPRFQTIAGSPYAYSTATVVALPNARLLQAMTHTLLEAGERYARPPILATEQAVRSDIDLNGDGITWIDKAYDERMGAAMRPMYQDRGGFPIGLELRDNVMSIMSSAFYLDKIAPPDMGREMTAYEFAERMKNYRRQNLPLFAPIESEYNGQLCEVSFSMMMDMGLLGSPKDIPESIAGADVLFKFKSPLSAAEEEEKANRFAQVRDMLAGAADLDPGVIENVNLDTALREAVVGIGAPQRWLFPREVTADRRIAKKMEQVGQEMLMNPPPDVVEGQAAQ